MVGSGLLSRPDDTARREPRILHRRPAQGRAPRPPRRVGVAADRLRARGAPPRRGRPGRPGGAPGVLHVPRLRPLHRGLPRGRRPDPHARGRPAADLRGRARDGAGPEPPLRRAHLHAVHVCAPRHPDPGLHRGHRGRAGRGRARLRPGAAVDLRHPRRVRGPGRRRDAGVRPRAPHRRAGRLRPRRPGDRGAAAQFEPHFDTARAAGLRSVPHAGETTGPETIWSRCGCSAPSGSATAARPPRTRSCSPTSPRPASCSRCARRPTSRPVPSTGSRTTRCGPSSRPGSR